MDLAPKRWGLHVFIRDARIPSGLGPLDLQVLLGTREQLVLWEQGPLDLQVLLVLLERREQLVFQVPRVPQVLWDLQAIPGPQEKVQLDLQVIPGVPVLLVLWERVRLDLEAMTGPPVLLDTQVLLGAQDLFKQLYQSACGSVLSPCGTDKYLVQPNQTSTRDPWDGMHVMEPLSTVKLAPLTGSPTWWAGSLSEQPWEIPPPCQETPLSLTPSRSLLTRTTSQGKVVSHIVCPAATIIKLVISMWILLPIQK